MSNIRYELFARDSVYNLSLFILNEVSWSSKINGNCGHNHIAIYDFTPT